MEQKQPTRAVDLTPIEQAYTAELIVQAIKIIKNEKPLTENNPFFGKGRFLASKRPTTTPKRSLNFGPENFKVGRMSAQFLRRSLNDPWDTAHLSQRPDGFPDVTFLNNFPPQILQGFKLQKTFVELSEDGPVKQLHVFDFVETGAANPVLLRVRSHPALSTLSDAYPKNFFRMTITSRAKSLLPED